MPNNQAVLYLSGVAIKYGPITALAFTIKLLLQKNCFYKKIAFTKKLLCRKVASCYISYDYYD